MFNLDLGNIISNSFKYPFKDLKHLAFVFLLFVLTIVLPIGLAIENEITIAIGVIALLVFILTIPGYRILVIKSGIGESQKIPTIKIGRSIINTFKLLILHICYITIPAIIVFVLMSFVTGLFVFPMDIIDSLFNFTFTFKLVNDFIGAILTTFIAVMIVMWVFSLLSYIAKARMANSNSLIEALKIHKVIKDIGQIGIARFLGWYFVMLILIGFVGIITFPIMSIAYVGFIVYICIVIPVLLLIHNYSVGLLYSNVMSNETKDDEEFDFEKFEKEIEYIKYGLLH